MSDRLATLNQAAAHLGVHTGTVRKYIGAGYFPAYKGVRGVRGLVVDLDEVDEGLKAHGVTPSNYGTYGPKAIIKDLRFADHSKDGE